MTSPDLAAEHLLVRVIDTADDLDGALRAAVFGLAATCDRYHWVGIYLLEGDALVLHNEDGNPTPHTRIPISQGLCGAAARERQTIVVDDVRQDPRYLACSPETRSEIVVPIMDERGRVFGEIDIDSDEPGGFGPEDRSLIETVASALAARFEAARA